MKAAHLLSTLVRYGWALPNTLVGLLLAATAMLPGGSVRVVDGVLEAHGPLIAAILQHGVVLPGGASAMTFGHVVAGRDRESLDAARAHERVHVRQCEIWGPAFIPAYLVAGLMAWMRGTGAYAGNYFERQARRRDTYPSGLVCRSNTSSSGSKEMRDVQS
jgi:ABC-type sulfate transport system permease component